MAEEQPQQQPPQPQPNPSPPPQPAAQPEQKPQQPAQPQQAGGSPKKAPFILSLVAGILIVGGGAMFLALGGLMAAMGMGMLEMTGIAEMAGIMGMITTIYAAVGIALGVLVIVGAVLMRNPARAKMGAILVLVCSIISFFAGGGFFIGMILGIIGGALGLKG